MYDSRWYLESSPYRQYPMSYSSYYPVQYYVQQQPSPIDPVDTLTTIMLVYGVNDVRSLLGILPKEVLYQVLPLSLLREMYLKKLGVPLRAVPGQALGTYEYSVADYIRNHGQPPVDQSGELSLNNLGLTSLNGLDQIISPEKVAMINLSNNYLSNKYIDDVFSTFVDPYSNIPLEPFKHFANVLEVNLGNNKFDAVPNLFFGTRLQVLNLFENQLKTIKQGAFKNLNDLKELNLFENQINRIEPGAFRGLDRLSALNLENNQINSIEQGVFWGLSNLGLLNIGNNEIETIERGAFEGLNRLGYLHLFRNQINRIEPGAFEGLNLLIGLNLDNNEIKTIEPGAFEGLDRLDYLNLADNKIKLIGAFEGLKLLESLDLDNNEIETIERGAFEGLDNLSTLSIKNNYIPGTKEEFIENHPSLKWVVVKFDPQKAISSFTQYWGG